MNKRTQEQALRALDGMAEIVRREMLVRRDYLTPEVVNPKLAEAGAICGGHKACAIGALWLGGGVKPQAREYDPARFELPGVGPSERHDFLSHRHGLRAALDALNASAAAYIERHDLRRRIRVRHSDDTIENLFEAGSIRRPLVGRRELLLIISSAKRRIRAA